MVKPSLLINLPEGFYSHPYLGPCFARLEGMFGEVRRRSWNTAEEIAGDLGFAEAILMWSWPKLLDEQLEMASRLRILAQLDVSQAGARAAFKKGVPVSHGRYAWSPAVAELALALILNCLRRVSDYHAAMRVGAEAWVKSFPGDIDVRERQLTGRPVGIVGFGQIGRRLAELLAPFRCPISVYDPFVDEAVVKAFHAHRLSLTEVFERNEVVVLCAAANEGTRRLIGAEQIEAMPRDGVFVNVCRAALVDTEALVARLRRGDLMAAVDVFDEEPLPGGHELRGLKGAYLTPHRGGGVMESVRRILSYLTDDLQAFFEGTPRKHVLHEGMIPALDA